MITNISTGNYTVVESNVVYLYKYDMDLVLDFQFDNNFKFKIRIFFEDDQETKDQSLQYRTSEDLVEFKCKNFKNELGTGTIIPVEIATIENKRLYIHFWSFIHGNLNAEKFVRKVEYTVFLER